jgi:hypothetical protein
MNSLTKDKLIWEISDLIRDEVSTEFSLEEEAMNAADRIVEYLIKNLNNGVGSILHKEWDNWQAGQEDPLKPQ